MRDKFFGGDQSYLREQQYRDPSNLTARASIHVAYRTAPVAWFPWLVAQVDWPDDGEVLDAGCGPGWLWVEGADGLPDGLRITLTDLSPGMVETASEQVARCGFAVEARVADVQDLPYADDSFDVVVANHMLYHVPDPDRAVGELARVARPGGVVVTATNGPDSLIELWEIEAEVFGGPRTSAAFEIFGRVTGRPIVEQHLADVEWLTYDDELHCTDADDVVAYLTSVPPAEDGTPEQIAALRAAVERGIADGGGVLRVTKDTGLFLGRSPRNRRG